MSDADIKREEFLEYISIMLTTSEIPNLLTKDERDTWLGDLVKPYVKEKGSNNNTDPPQSELWQYFINRVRDNFHIILCFSPIGE